MGLTFRSGSSIRQSHSDNSSCGSFFHWELRSGFIEQETSISRIEGYHRTVHKEIGFKIEETNNLLSVSAN